MEYFKNKILGTEKAGSEKRSENVPKNLCDIKLHCTGGLGNNTLRFLDPFKLRLCNVLK